MATTKSKTFVDRRVRRWCVMDLVTDPHSGKMRETLLWSNLGKATALVCFIYNVYSGTDSEWLWLVVMAVLTCHAAFSQYISTKMPPMEQPK